MGKNPVMGFARALGHCTEVRFVSFLSGGFTTIAVINPPDWKLVNRTSVHWVIKRERKQNVNIQPRHAILYTLFKDNSLSQFYFPGLFSLLLIHT